MSEYNTSMVIISAHICTSQMFFPVYHWFNLVFLVPFFCIFNGGDILSARWMSLLLCVSL